MSKRFIIKSICTLAVLIITGSAFAQQRYELSVKEAVDLAFKNLPDVKNANLDVQIQQAQNKEITGQALPQLSGTSSLQRYFSLPKILLPDQNGKLKEISFVQPWNTSAGATLSQLLFQPDVFVGLKARRVALDASIANLEVVRERVKDSAYRRYYAILIAEKQATFLRSGIERLQKLYHDDSIMFINGFAERLDLDKVQVQLTNIQSSLVILENAIKLSYAALKFSIGVSQNDVVVLRERLSADDIKRNVLIDTFKYEDRKEILALMQARKLQQLNVKRNKLGYIPTLSAFASYTAQGQGQNFVTNNNTFWFRTGLAGLNLNVPIFDGFQRKYKVQQAQLNLKKVDNTFDNLKQVIDLQQTVSKESLKSALINLDAQQRNVELAERVYNTTKKKFESGLGSSFEVLQSDNDWQTAQSNYFTGLYNAIIAKISYQSSIGKLD